MKNFFTGATAVHWWCGEILKYRTLVLFLSTLRWAQVGDRNRGYATQTGKACKINVVSASNEMSSALFVRNLSST